jgi:hypothetical protein
VRVSLGLGMPATANSTNNGYYMDNVMLTVGKLAQHAHGAARSSDLDSSLRLLKEANPLGEEVTLTYEPD